MPPGLSPVHVIVVLVVALIVLGPEKLPDAARQVARFLVEARQLSARFSAEVEQAVSAPTVPEQRADQPTAQRPPAKEDA